MARHMAANGSGIAPAGAFDLPDTVIPHSVIALGYPVEDITPPRESRYEENRVHFNEW